MTQAPPETKTVHKRKLACDGGEGALGHPRVWLTIPEDRGWVECPYCDARYILANPEDAAA
ncbi:MAG: zinc-finger domain-containing protein [Rhodobacterales bacterium]|nr:MAG: zinc-finger domain-containing protein [Rhodobacterales bacterium]